MSAPLLKELLFVTYAKAIAQMGNKLILKSRSKKNGFFFDSKTVAITGVSLSFEIEICDLIVPALSYVDFSHRQMSRHLAWR